MDTLLRAGTIRSIKEVWWDIRPHPDFGTVEIRMFDGVPTLREVGMVAALSQCLVQLFDTAAGPRLHAAVPVGLGGQGQQVARDAVRAGRHRDH